MWPPRPAFCANEPAITIVSAIVASDSQAPPPGDDGGAPKPMHAIGLVRLIEGERHDHHGLPGVEYLHRRRPSTTSWTFMARTLHKPRKVEPNRMRARVETDQGLVTKINLGPVWTAAALHY